ncbi:GGDEF domain-containing protein [Marinitoga sp. 1155]|uniref:GGDEF domain-containing protein n=1 Tax=Marinitoga sp. 1155 TaxID=1428448 RepID=UPI000699F5DE|nr:GGDEF domain-containing protein [Marinitoga sp. 1155]
MDNTTMEKLKKYKKHIMNSKFDIGFFFLIENLSKFIDLIDIDIYISENPAFVPENIYKIINLSGKFKMLNLRNIFITHSPKNQKVCFSYKDKNIIFNNDLLIKTESDILHYIILNASQFISLEIIHILLKSSALSYIMLNSKEFLEEATKKDTDINKLIYIYLTVITMNFGGNFNRAILFQKKDDTYVVLRALGSADEKEAHLIWEQLEKNNYSFKDIIKNFKQKAYFSSLEKRIKNFKLSKYTIFKYKLFKEFLDYDTATTIPASALPKKLVKELDIIGECAICSLKSENKDFGFILVDNRFNHKPISNEQLYILDYFSKQTTILWENKLFIDTLKFEAQQDFLTGFYNRRSLDKFIESLTLSGKSKIGIVIIDIDFFKEINDTHGHDKGDEIIKTLSEIIFKNIRSKDKAFRFGGDEFLLILDDIDEINLFRIIRRINIEFREKTGASFSSGGIVCKNSQKIYKCIKIADKLLYNVKRTSKGQIKIK